MPPRKRTTAPAVSTKEKATEKKGKAEKKAAPASSPSSTLPARLELTCSVPGSLEPFLFVAEGTKFVVGRVKNGRHGLCLKDDSVSSRHAEIEWVPILEEGAGAEKGGGAASSSSSSGVGRAARAATRGGRGGGASPPSSSSSLSTSTPFVRPQALGGAWVLRDLESSNGTAVNGLRVEPLEAYELKHSDELSFGSGATTSSSPSSRCTVSLQVCETRSKEITTGQFIAIETGKEGDRLKAEAERAAGTLRARFRAHKARVYEDALAAWRASRAVAAAAAAGGAVDGGAGEGDSSAASASAARKLHASLQRLRLWTLDGGGGSGGGSGNGKENVGA